MQPRHLIDPEAHKESLEALRKEYTAGLALAMQSAFIPGMIMPFSGTFGGSDGKRPVNPYTGTANEGFALCDGGTYQASKTSPLITTPNLRDRFILGAGESFAIGAVGGTHTHNHNITVNGHTLSWAQMPNHYHTFYKITQSVGTHNVYPGLRLTGSNEVKLNYTHQYPNNPPSTQLNVTTSGSSQAHAHGASASTANHMPPYYALTYIMKL